MEITVGTTELTIGTLGAVQVMDLMVAGAKNQFVANAKLLSADLSGREKAAFMADALRTLNGFGLEEADGYGESVDAMSKMLAKAAGISADKAYEVLQGADDADIKLIMESIRPPSEADEKAAAFQETVDAVLSARLDGDQDAMDEAVAECSDALRSVSAIESAEGNA